MASLCLVFCVPLLSACTTENLYNTAKELAAYQCMSMPPSEADRCIQQMNKASFDEYQASQRPATQNTNPPPKATQSLR